MGRRRGRLDRRRRPIAAPSMASDAARHWIVAVFAVVYGCAALGNAWVTRGRHPGWMLLTAAIGFALAGL
jgi:hypothetical protein